MSQILVDFCFHEPLKLIIIGDDIATRVADKTEIFFVVAINELIGFFQF
jgi:hypothetical protein